jgi:hypothetical protein
MTSNDAQLQAEQYLLLNWRGSFLTGQSSKDVSVCSYIPSDPAATAMEPNEHAILSAGMSVDILKLFFNFWGKNAAWTPLEDER